jgi:hypothetical protein
MIYKNVPEIHCKINTIEGFPMKKINSYDFTPCDVIFNHTEKPKDYIMCKSINVYDDRWRINVYSKRMVNGIEGKYISKSFFTSFNTNSGELKIIA